MAYSYPIWIDVTSCQYKSSKSYGARDTNFESIKVGTSAKYSHDFYTRATNRKILSEYRGFTDVIVFRGYHNGICVEELVLSQKTREVLERRSAVIQELE
jgi:hypothetical protein